jgi:two-component system LytT family response regulator
VRAFLAAEPGVELVGEAGDGRQALEAIAREDPDVVFLDVDMPELDGFGVLEALGGATPPVVVFCTAHEHFALRAFDVHAQDYLVKPFGRERFRQAFERAREAVEERGEELRAEQIQSLLEQLREDQRGLQRILAGPEYLERVMVKTRDRAVLLPIDGVDWVEAEGNYVRLHAGKDSYLVRWKIGALEERLDPRAFARIHRSTIVNLDRVKEVRPWFAGDYLVKLHDGGELRLSRRYRDRLL